jgi:hypothetical protein
MEAALQPRPTRDAGVLLVAVVTMFALHAIPRALLMQNEDDGWTMRKKGLPGWVSRREVADYNNQAAGQNLTQTFMMTRITMMKYSMNILFL